MVSVLLVQSIAMKGMKSMNFTTRLISGAIVATSNCRFLARLKRFKGHREEVRGKKTVLKSMRIQITNMVILFSIFIVIANRGTGKLLAIS